MNEVKQTVALIVGRTGFVPCSLKLPVLARLFGLSLPVGSSVMELEE